MFSETLLDHARYPRNGGPMEAPDAVGRADRDGQPPITTILLRVKDERIVEIKFQTFGCGVSVAACSVLTELAHAKTLTEGLRITAAEVVEALDGVPDDRSFCVTLALRALHRAIVSLSTPSAPAEPRP